MYRETLLLFVYFEACHYNSSFSTKMPLNTYGQNLGPAAGVYEDVYFISHVTDTRTPHAIFFFPLSSSPSSCSHLPSMAIVRCWHDAPATVEG